MISLIAGEVPVKLGGAALLAHSAKSSEHACYHLWIDRLGIFNAIDRAETSNEHAPPRSALQCRTEMLDTGKMPNWEFTRAFIDIPQ